jgi:uncharacterized protein YbjT (DUF2867 family)
MRILVIGATGLIGAAIVAGLESDAHEIVGMARNVARARTRQPKVQWVEFDIARALSSKAWLPHLAGVDAVVNCAGALQSGPGDSVEGVHSTGAAALFAACEDAGIRRVIHFSAIGVDKETPTEFSRTKLEGDRALMSRDLDWVILRPSVVLGRAAYGGSALFRGLAALPILPVMPGAAPLQVVQLDEVVETVRFLLRADSPSRMALELAGPEQLTMMEIVGEYRRWLGWKKARSWKVPEWLATLVYRLGDFAGLLGWRPPVRTTAQREILRGAVGDPAEWMRVTGITPRPLASALTAEPASVQEGWFASMYVLKPVLFTVFALFWIGTGLISLGPGWEIGIGYMLAGGAGALSGPSVVAGALADIVIGIAIAVRRTTRIGLYAALAISLFYVIAGTAILPSLWLDPLGPMLKIWPVLVLNLVAIAILGDR